MLVVISGLPGTGKSAVAVEVARRTGAVHLSIDTVEDAMLGGGLERSWTTGAAAYEAVRAVAEQNLALGLRVVVDAVNDSEIARDTWRRAAGATNASLTFVLLMLDDETEHQRRLAVRERNLRSIVEPTWDDVRRRAAEFEPWLGDHLRVEADRPLAQIVDEVVAGIRPRHILVTGMSGAGKSTLLDELGRRGRRVVDTDYDGWVLADGRWDEERMTELLASDEAVVVQGTVENQGRFYDRFAAVILLSAPLEVLLERVSARTNNPYGATAEDRERIAHDVRTVEPLLRAGATVELDGREPVTALADRVEALIRGDR
ncbi:hypothetical protein GCM10009775_05860 [Microbacterium aoyamense]|uniref:ATP-binding protein n=1 Tax=Microbacterium aoyamense TaxID=344166 RepID=A0ABN2PAN1_9MICO|nr:AAA family ATPase [Microbacterium aoyamense]